MPDWNIIDGSNAIDTVGDTAADSGGKSITNGTGNSKGSWGEVIDSTPIAAAGFILMISQTNAAVLTDMLVDIGIGGSGSETVLIENILVSGRALLTMSVLFEIPIPAGTRVAARGQNPGGTGATTDVVPVLIPATFTSPSGLGRAATYGAVTGDSGGTAIDPGGSANTKGSWGEIAASTTNPIRRLYVIIGNQGNVARTDCTWLVDIGIGGSGSEQVLIPDLLAAASTNNDIVTPAIVGPIPVDLPAGTRIAARCQCSITDATDRTLDIVLIGVD